MTFQIDLTGRAAVVTGAASGIGAASARLLASAGAAVCCADVNGDGAGQVAAEIRDQGGQAIGHVVDVTDPDSNRAMVKAAMGEFGSLRIVVLNAGVFSVGSVLDVTLEEWERVMAVNLRGVLLGIQAGAEAILEHDDGGTIVITSSGAGLMGSACGSAYAASKHGVLGLMKCAAADLARRGVRVNAVCPGAIDTPILGRLHGNAGALQQAFGDKHPIGRVGTPEEVASVVTFLASDAASYLTGLSLPVDGGISSSFVNLDRPRRSGAERN